MCSSEEGGWGVQGEEGGVVWSTQEGTLDRVPRCAVHVAVHATMCSSQAGGWGGGGKCERGG